MNSTAHNELNRCFYLSEIAKKDKANESKQRSMLSGNFDDLRIVVIHAERENWKDD